MSNIKIVFRKGVLHLFLFPSLFVTNHFWSIVNPLDPMWKWLLDSILAIVLCSTLTMVVFWIMARFVNQEKAAILALVLCMPFFFFQDIFLASENFFLIGLRARWILPGLVALLAIFGIWAVLTKRALIKLNHYLNTVSLILFLYTLVILVFASPRQQKRLTYTPQAREVFCQQCPDIYLFLLDSYASNKSLRDYFDFDNKDFTQGLERLSFEVTDQAISGYTQTEYSIASTLNLNQIPHLETYRFGIGEAIQNSSVTHSLLAAGYKIHNYSLFDVHNQPPFYSITPSASPKFLNGIIQSSILNMFFDISLKMNLYGIHTDILTKMESANAAQNDQSDFFYGHIMAPHPPFVMDENGQEISFFEQTKSANNVNAYVNQLKGLNKLVLGCVEKIVTSSPQSIVIIMGDHGYRYLYRPETTREAFTVFLAYHGPNQQGIKSLGISNEIFQLVLAAIGPSTRNASNMTE